MYAEMQVEQVDQFKFYLFTENKKINMFFIWALSNITDCMKLHWTDYYFMNIWWLQLRFVYISR